MTVVISKPLVDDLRQQGWHLVTTREWYEMQARVAQAVTALEAAHEFAKSHVSGSEMWFVERDHVRAVIEDALVNTPNEYVQRVQALERFYAACKEAHEAGQAFENASDFETSDAAMDRAKKAAEEAEAAFHVLEELTGGKRG